MTSGTHITLIWAILSAICLAAGIAGVSFVNRRRFYRRNEHGIEGFESYGSMVATRRGEGCLKIISWFLILGTSWPDRRVRYGTRRVGHASLTGILLTRQLRYLVSGTHVGDNGATECAPFDQQDPGQIQ